MYENILNRLYERELYLKTLILCSDSEERAFDVVLRNNDCKISHFGYNLYFRTKKGIEYKRYKSLGRLLYGIERRAKELGLVVLGFSISENDNTPEYFFTELKAMQKVQLLNKE